MTRILIADDHHISRRGLRALLETHPDWEVVAEAEDGYEAIDAAMRTAPDIAIIDCAMPRMNGLEAARRIHQHLPGIEICLLNDGEDEAIVASAIRIGARGFVLKSDSSDDLLAAIDSMSHHRPHFSPAVSDTLLEHFVKHNGNAQNIELLTPREREVVQLVAEGLSNKNVSKQLDLSVKTVETHRAAAMRKAGLSSIADLVRYAVRNHMVQP